MGEVTPMHQTCPGTKLEKQNSSDVLTGKERNSYISRESIEMSNAQIFDVFNHLIIIRSTGKACNPNRNPQKPVMQPGTSIFIMKL